MKKITLMLVAAVLSIATLTSTTIYAQEKKQSLREVLGLTKEVDQKIKDIKATYKEQEETVKATTLLDEKAKKARLKEVRAERETKINDLLTKEQQVKYEAYKEESKKQKEAEKKKEGE